MRFFFYFFRFYFSRIQFSICSVSIFGMNLYNNTIKITWIQLLHEYEICSSVYITVRSLYGWLLRLQVPQIPAILSTPHQTSVISSLMLLLTPLMQIDLLRIFSVLHQMVRTRSLIQPHLGIELQDFETGQNRPTLQYCCCLFELETFLAQIRWGCPNSMVIYGDYILK